MFLTDLHHENILVIIESETADDVADVPLRDWAEILVTEIEFRNVHWREVRRRFAVEQAHQIGRHL